MSAAPSWETEADAYPGLGLLLAGVERRERAALEHAQHALRVAVRAADRAVPCLVPGPNLWLSDDAMQRQVAVRRCGSCPVIAQCTAVVAAVPSQAWGVFGGRDYSTVTELAELRQLGAAAVPGLMGAAARVKRDELLVELGRSRRWSSRQLADAAGVGVSHVSRLWARRGVARQRTEAEMAELTRRNGPRLRELRAIRSIPHGPHGDATRLRRDVLLAEVWETDREFWTVKRLAWMAGVSWRAVSDAIRRARDCDLPTHGQPPPQRSGESWAERSDRYRAEAAASDDPRVALLLGLVRELAGLHGPVDRASLIKDRNELAARLWAEDPRFWSVTRLAAVIRASSTTIHSLLATAQHEHQEAGAR